MNNLLFSILIFILGLIIGIVLFLFISYLKKQKEKKDSESMIEKAKKDADKIKRNSLFETKEEIHKSFIQKNAKRTKDKIIQKNKNKMYRRFVNSNEKD